MFALASISRPEGVCQSPNRTSVLEFARENCKRIFVGHVVDVTYESCLYFNYQGKDHGAAADLAGGEVAKCILDLVLEYGDGCLLLDDLAHCLLGTLDQVFLLTHVDEAAADDLRAIDDFAIVFVDRDDADDKAILAELLAVAQHHAADIAHAQAVHIDGAGGNHLAELGRHLAAAVEVAKLERMAVLEDKDVVGASRLPAAPARDAARGAGTRRVRARSSWGASARACGGSRHGRRGR